ncbi:MAG TPA: amino acid adenylation domain-containing protein, partial [Longimicrobium sp.]|nr:amino acid adenylation domain-containing protein [Longimicrobium sp.]
LARVVSGGEALTPALVRELHARLPNARLLHEYGPTEATVASTVRVCTADSTAPGASIGRPINNTRVYLLDRAGEPVPVGVAGELHIGGAGVARGYLGRPELTAERFVADPYTAEPGARMYRTGDLARWLADGTLEFLGRNDFQVKVRGFRIEPGEIEAQLELHPGVREAVVDVQQDAAGDGRLVAYVLPAPDAARGRLTVELRAHVAGRLPEYMAPAAYVVLDALPLTPNGKVDRRALPAPDVAAFATRDYEAPIGEIEEAVAEIWADVLGLDRVGRDDSFFELGGHSLLAVRVISRVRQVLAVETALGDLFLRPVLREFARGLAAAAHSDLPPILPARRGGDVPLSFAQQRLWFLEQLGGMGATYHIPSRLRLTGALDRAALERALARIVARHEALRTTFGHVDGSPVQRITAGGGDSFALAEHDFTAEADADRRLDELMMAEARAPFDLERGPLVRGRLVSMAADDHVLLLTMHHIVSDGWSMGVLVRELSTLYGAFTRGEADPLAPLPVQYADYAVWQREWIGGAVLESQAAYWRSTLAGAPELLALPSDHPRPARADHVGATVRLGLTEELTYGLKALGRRHGTTLFMTLMAGWATVLGRLAGQSDVVIGTPSANRGRTEVEGLIGFFVNTLAVRVNTADEPTVAELLARVKAQTLGAQHNQDIPFEQVVELVQPTRSLAHSPLFQVMFAWQTAAGGGFELPGLTVGTVGAPTGGAAKFDMSLSLQDAGGRIVGSLTYATALFGRATVERYAGYLVRVLEQMVADDAQPVARLALLPDDERRRMVTEWNATEEAFPRDVCLHELVQARAARTPDAVALVYEGEALTYREVNERANQLAHHLRGLGVGPDRRVGLCLERGAEMVIAVLGVMKAGGAYVPLDPAYPADRLRFMLADSAPEVLLTQERLDGELATLFGDITLPVFHIDAAVPAWAGLPATDPERGGVSPQHPAYVIYTSGSTGRPKGVLLQHAAMVNRLMWMQEMMQLREHDALLQNASFSFDASVWEFFLPMMAGARVVMVHPDRHRDPAEIVATIHRERITQLFFVGSLLQLFLDTPGSETCTAVARVVTGGEALQPVTVRRFYEQLPGAVLYNFYGPSEAAVAVRHPTVPADGARAQIPIGRPVPNMRIYLLDERGEPVPMGVTGEVFVGGAQVARGYLDRPALTADRFGPDPFGGEAGARLYRTGDLARWGGDERLEFLGRNDFQVKVRGQRVELGEIEARLADHPDVREAVVMAREDVPGDQRLVAYFTTIADVEVEALRTYLAERLPGFMVPAAYVRLEALPLTPSSKLDRRALPAPEDDAYARRAYAEPQGETERLVAEVWADVLGIDRVGRWDNFFELGGHSLLVVKLVERMRKHQLHADVRALFTTTTLAELAAEVRSESNEIAVPPNLIPYGCAAIRPEMLPLVALDQASIDRITRTVPGGAANVQDIYPLAPLQEGILFHHLMTAEGDPYLTPALYAFETRARLDAYLAAIQGVIDRHDIWRTAMLWEGVSEPVQVVLRRATLPVEEVELDGEGDAGDELYERFNPRRHRIDVRTAPLMRAVIAHDKVQGRWLLLVRRHHMASDHMSGDVLREEVQAQLAGRAASLPPALPFRDFVAQTRLGVNRDDQEAFFGKLLGDVHQPTAPFGLLDVQGDGSEILQHKVRVDAALAERLRARSRVLRVSTASLCHVAWAQVLARVTGHADVVFGTVLFGRMQGGAGASRVMGPFINTLPVRVRVGTDGAEATVRRTHALLGDLLRHEHASLALAQRCSGVRAPTPLFSSIMNYRHRATVETRAPVMAPREADGHVPLRMEERTNYPMTFSVDDLGDEGFRLTIKVKAPVDPARVCALVHAALEGLADALEGAPDAPLAGLNVLPAAERDEVVSEWNATDAAYPRESCIHELVEARVRRAPDAVAVVFEGTTLTYREVNRRANRLAHHLRGLGVGPDTRVAISVERSLEMTVGLLAILKAGGAYVPLDPSYPADRLQFMLEDSAPVVLLTQERLGAMYAGAPMPVLFMDAATLAWAGEPATDPELAGLTPADAAYVIYTSGSTGRPKGVLLEHRAMVNRLMWMQELFGLGATDAMLQNTSFSF